MSNRVENKTMVAKGIRAECLFLHNMVFTLSSSSSWWLQVTWASPRGTEQMLLIMTRASEVCIAGKSAVAGERGGKKGPHCVWLFAFASLSFWVTGYLFFVRSARRRVLGDSSLATAWKQTVAALQAMSNVSAAAGGEILECQTGLKMKSLLCNRVIVLFKYFLENSISLLLCDWK